MATIVWSRRCALPEFFSTHLAYTAGRYLEHALAESFYTTFSYAVLTALDRKGTHAQSARINPTDSVYCHLFVAVRSSFHIAASDEMTKRPIRQVGYGKGNSSTIY